MNPLTVTWAPNLWTEIGRQNFESLSKKAGLNNILITPSGELHMHLTKLAFENLGHPFQPFIHGQKVIGPKIANRFGIKLVIYGENQAEYGNPINENNESKMDQQFFTVRNPLEIKFGGLTIKEIIKRNQKFKLSDFNLYFPLTEKEVQRENIEMIYLGFFEKWDPQEIYYYAHENTGFRPSTLRSEGTYSRYAEIDDKMVPIHFYTTHTKFGLGRASYDASQEIRNGHITRSEAINLVKKYDGECPQDVLPEFLEYADISIEKFRSTIDRLRPDHLWEKVGGDFVLKNPIWKNTCD